MTQLSDSQTAYDALVNAQEEALRVSRVEAIHLRLPRDEIHQRLIDITTDYESQLNDPARTELQPYREQRVMEAYEQEGIHPRRLGADEWPELRHVIAEQTQRLNELTGLHYPVPTLISIRSPEGSNSTSYSMEGGVFALEERDWDVIRDNPEALRALVGHELAHRYNRDPEFLRALTTVTYLSEQGETVETSPALADAYTAWRADEALSDFRAAQLTSPEIVGNWLTAMDAVDHNGLARFQREKLDLPADATDAQVNGRLMISATTSGLQLEAEFHALSPAERNDYLHRELVRLDENPLPHHPSVLSRMQLQAALADHPELLQATDIRFDGASNITNADLGGLPLTSSNLATINRAGDEKVAGGGIQ